MHKEICRRYVYKIEILKSLQDFISCSKEGSSGLVLGVTKGVVFLYNLWFISPANQKGISLSCAVPSM
jgi:hypothetical protein